VSVEIFLGIILFLIITLGLTMVAFVATVLTQHLNSDHQEHLEDYDKED
jgi:hypothetical protein